MARWGGDSLAQAQKSWLAELRKKGAGLSFTAVSGLLAIRQNPVNAMLSVGWLGCVCQEGHLGQRIFTLFSRCSCNAPADPEELAQFEAAAKQRRADGKRLLDEEEVSQC